MKEKGLRLVSSISNIHYRKWWSPTIKATQWCLQQSAECLFGEWSERIEEKLSVSDDSISYCNSILTGIQGWVLPEDCACCPCFQSSWECWRWPWAEGEWSCPRTSHSQTRADCGSLWNLSFYQFNKNNYNKWQNCFLCQVRIWCRPSEDRNLLCKTNQYLLPSPLHYTTD